MTKAGLNCGIKNEQVLRQRASKGGGNFAFPRLTSHWQHIDSLSKYQRRSFAVRAGRRDSSLETGWSSLWILSIPPPSLICLTVGRTGGVDLWTQTTEINAVYTFTSLRLYSP